MTKENHTRLELKNDKEFWLVESMYGGVTIHLETAHCDYSFRVDQDEWEKVRDAVSGFMTSKEEEKFFNSQQPPIAERSQR